MSYRVAFESMNFARTSQPQVDLQVHSLSWSIYGGAERAVIDARGCGADLADLFERLRAPLCIYNRYGSPVWWGYLNEVSLRVGAGRLSRSLDEMANRLAVRYRYLAPVDQLGEVRQTAWADDPASQAHYGIKERVLRRDCISESYAEQLRDLSLAVQANPQARFEPEQTDWPEGVGARLVGLGWAHTLDWRSYQTSAGLIGNVPAQNGSQAIGASTTSLRAAASFTPSVDLSVRDVDLRLRREGSPADSIQLQLQADAGGLPSGSALGSSSLAGSSLAQESYPWVRFNFDPLVSLNAGVTYWLVLQRSGSASSSAYYLLGVDESLTFEGGGLRLYNQTLPAWVLRSPNADLLFRVLSVRQTSDQILDMYTAANQFLRGVESQASSDIYTPPFEQGNRSALTVMRDLLRLGTVNQRLLIARVSQGRTLRIAEQAAQGERDHFVDEAGQFYDQFGNRMMPGDTVVGEWLRERGGLAAAAFIEQAELDAGSGRVSVRAVKGEE